SGLISIPESVNRRGSSGPTIGATDRSAPSFTSSMAMLEGYPPPVADLRSLPSVDTLAGALGAPHPLAVAAARAVIAERRAELLAGGDGEADLEARARDWLARAERPSLRRVLNATGVLLHTNLGRAPLAAAA